MKKLRSPKILQPDHYLLVPQSNLANKFDPRVDSDLDGRGNRHGAATGGIMGASGSHATPGSGTAQNTAGPHNSDTLNKVSNVHPLDYSTSCKENFAYKRSLFFRLQKQC